MSTIESIPALFYSLMFACGLISGFVVFFAWRYAQLLEVRAQANGLVEEAKRKAADVVRVAEERFQDFSNQIKRRTEKDVKRMQQEIEKIQKKISDRETRFQERHSEKEKMVSEQRSMVDQYENKVSQLDQKFQGRRQNEQRLLEQYIVELAAKASTSREEIVESVKQKLVQDRQMDMTKWLQVRDDEIAADAEREARRLISSALNRFARPYCPERGIGYLNFENNDVRARVMGESQANLRMVEKLCGVDLVFDEANNSVNVYGFDPVRRELGRATVEKMMSERGAYDEARITAIVEKLKRDLFRKIMQDGNRLAKELHLDGLHQEIRNMMGALRYRYSFTQNQHFHCAEVGFMCGLLAAELGVDVKDARRAGMLHDIGKAMDHTTEGGHAVIGADFIKQHGEQDHIVHAVRAHHFDEQPNSDLAYLVITADALSGARPGARRSTAQTYSQKIQDLQSIARQFPGVTDTHIVSAGREVRIYVDGSSVDDHKALEISKGIADKIENEMAYPGQIKVTVVRSTQAVEYAR